MKLIALANGRFQIVDGGQTIEGTLPQIRQRMLENYSITAKEVEKALKDMMLQDHDTAVFGFMHSYSQALDRKVKAELRAIRDVRREFHALKSTNVDSPEVKQVYDRLCFLYFAQDVDGNLQLLGEQADAQEKAA